GRTAAMPVGVERDAARDDREAPPRVGWLGDEQVDDQHADQEEVGSLEPRVADAAGPFAGAAGEDEETAHREEVEDELGDDHVVEQVSVRPERASTDAHAPWSQRAGPGTGRSAWINRQPSSTPRTWRATSSPCWIGRRPGRTRLRRCGGCISPRATDHRCARSGSRPSRTRFSSGRSPWCWRPSTSRTFLTARTGFDRGGRPTKRWRSSAEG